MKKTISDSNWTELFQTMTTAAKDFAQDLATLIRYTQIPIENEEELLERAEVMDKLMDMAKSEEDIAMLFANAISDRIEEFERQELVFEKLPPSEILAHLIQLHGATHKDFSEFATKEAISELLSGKREMTIRHVKGFASYFQVPVSLFIQ